MLQKIAKAVEQQGLNAKMRSYIASKLKDTRGRETSLGIGYH